MAKRFADATVFTIAHRINTIITGDRVMVLDDGSCIEYDDPKVLTKNEDSEFFKLITEIENEKKEAKVEDTN
jgi:ABC-type multidrug transport system fused ATPase/permease subunit